MGSHVTKQIMTAVSGTHMDKSVYTRFHSVATALIPVNLHTVQRVASPGVAAVNLHKCNRGNILTKGKKTVCILVL